MAWKVKDEHHVTLQDVCGRAFEDSLDRPEGRMTCLDFDEIVKHNVSGDRPSSTDALIVTDDIVLFIEFKGGDDPPSDGSDLETPRSKTCGLKCKASDAVLLYHSFLDMNRSDNSKLKLIVVSKNGYDRIREKIRPETTRRPYCPEFLKMYMNRDNDGNRIFYDEVRWCTPDEMCGILQEVGNDTDSSLTR